MEGYLREDKYYALSLVAEVSHILKDIVATGSFLWGFPSYLLEGAWFWRQLKAEDSVEGPRNKEHTIIVTICHNTGLNDSSDKCVFFSSGE